MEEWGGPVVLLLCPPLIPCTGLGTKPCLRGERLVTNFLNHGTVLWYSHDNIVSCTVLTQDTRRRRRIISRMRGHNVSISSWKRSWSRSIWEEMVLVLPLHNSHHLSLPGKVGNKRAFRCIRHVCVCVCVCVHGCGCVRMWMWVGVCVLGGAGSHL